MDELKHARISTESYNTCRHGENCSLHAKPFQRCQCQAGLRSHNLQQHLCRAVLDKVYPKNHIAWDGSMPSDTVHGTAVLCQFFWGGQPLQALHPLKWGHRSMGQELLGYLGRVPAPRGVSPPGNSSTESQQAAHTVLLLLLSQDWDVHTTRSCLRPANQPRLYVREQRSSFPVCTPLWAAIRTFERKKKIIYL